MKLLSKFISCGSLMIAVIVLVAFVPRGVEGRVEGVGFTLGILGLPTTLLSESIMDLLMKFMSGDNGMIYTIAYTGCFLLQWQLVALMLYRRGRKNEMLR